jgi:hypothetical protein
MTLSFNTSLEAKTAHRTGAGFGTRTGRVGSPVVIAMARGAAITQGVRTADLNPHALAARCAD